MINEHFSLSSLGPTSHEESAHLLSNCEKQNSLVVYYMYHFASWNLIFDLFQFLLQNVEKLLLLPRKRIDFKNHSDWTRFWTPKIPSKCDTQSKIQSILFHSQGKSPKNASIKKLVTFIFTGAFQSIQILPELILLNHGLVTIHTPTTDWVLVHLLGTPGICHIRHYDP